MHQGGYVWSLDIDSLTMKRVTKGIWIEKALQWINDKYLLIQWCPYTFLTDTSRELSFSFGFLKID